MPRSDEYTVLWMCAIPEEYAVATSFLDERYEKPSGLPDNVGRLGLGRIEGHNVVVGTCGIGDYGQNSAAWVAARIMNRFPNIRYGIMVGVAGGVPSPKHDIRLGDVVVSVPCNGQNGCFEYDRGEIVQGERMKQIASPMNPPPRVLLEAVQKLKYRYKQEAYSIDSVVEKTFAKWPQLRRHYRRPNPETDRLYRSDFVHPLNYRVTDCSQYCSSSGLVRRPQRTLNAQSPMIHYGLIGTGNLVVRDSVTRDRLAQEQEILCFETESAALMTILPLLVVRGICDYADSHKNKEWQPYAAIAAAAYAKDLLIQVKYEDYTGVRNIGELASRYPEKYCSLCDHIFPSMRHIYSLPHFMSRLLCLFLGYQMLYFYQVWSLIE